MISLHSRPMLRPARLVACVVLLACPGVRAEERGAGDAGLVRVTIFKSFTDTRGAGQTVELNGRTIPNYHPTIIQVFPSLGVVIDDKNNVVTFLGYGWVDLYGGNLRVEIVAGSEGPKLRGKLIGIDQSTGVAVVRPLEGKLRKSALCVGCEIRDGATVVLPIPQEQGSSQFERAQVLGVGTAEASPFGGWQITINRRLETDGAPLLDANHRVLGFIANQGANAPAAPSARGIGTLVFPMSQLLTSAGRIIEAGGDVRTGWLGVYLHDSAGEVPVASGIRIKSVTPGGPAARSGLLPGDVLVKWNGKLLRDVRQFIRLVQEAPVGSTVELGLLRRGAPASASAVIGTRKPEANRGAFVVRFSDVITFPDPSVPPEIASRNEPGEERPRIGAEIVALTPQLAEFLGIPVQTGLLVSSVQPNMPAAVAGVQAGDVILSIDGVPLSEPLSFVSHVQSRGWGSTVVLRYLRKKVERVARVHLKPPVSPGRK